MKIAQSVTNHTDTNSKKRINSTNSTTKNDTWRMSNKSKEHFKVECN